MTRQLKLAVLVTALSAALPAAGQAQTRNVDKTIDLDAGAQLTLISHKGSVTLTPWDRNQVEIHARIEAPTGVGADYARSAIEAADIRVTGDRRSLRVEPDYDRVPNERAWLGGDSRSIPPVHFEIRAPRKLDLDLRVDRTTTRLGAFEGLIEVDSDRGDLEAEGVAGDLRIHVDRGDRVTLTGVRGSVDVTADRSDVRVTFAGVERDSRIDVDRGSVEVAMGDAQRLDLRADIERRASFDSEFPVTTNGWPMHRIEGTINGGGPRLTLHSQRGRVRLRKAGA